MTLKDELIQKLSKLDESANAEELKKITNDFLSPGTKLWRGYLGWFLMVLSSILAVIMLTLLFNLCYEKIHIPFIYLLAYAAWVIIPPSWFLFEYVWIFPYEDKMDTNKAADMRYTQKLAGQIWAGLVLLIGAALFLSFPIPK